MTCAGRVSSGGGGPCNHGIRPAAAGARAGPWRIATSICPWRATALLTTATGRTAGMIRRVLAVRANCAASTPWWEARDSGPRRDSKPLPCSQTLGMHEPSNSIAEAKGHPAACGVRRNSLFLCHTVGEFEEVMNEFRLCGSWSAHSASSSGTRGLRYQVTPALAENGTRNGSLSRHSAEMEARLRSRSVPP